MVAGVEAVEPLTPQQQDLVARGWPAAQQAMQKWTGRCSLPREMIEDACVDGLIAAARKYRPGRARFGTWLYTTLDWRVRKAAQREQQRRAGRPDFDLDAPSGEREKTGMEPGRFLRYNESGYLRVEVREMLARLPERSRQVLILYYLEGLTTSEMAARMGAPSSSVSRWIREGRDRLRSLMP